MALLVDTWIHKLVLSNIEELSLAFFVNHYTLPEVLFSARSLKSLQCSNVKLAHNGVINLTSLVDLSLYSFVADEIMLQHIISVCPLIDLVIDLCVGIANISIPNSSSIKNLRLHKEGVINLEIAGNLQGLVYFSYIDEELWPCKVRGTALRSLKNLELFSTSLTDEIFQSTISELQLLEKLEFHNCGLPSDIHISSDSLKTLTLDDCGFLESAVINAPNLGLIRYIGDIDTSLSFTSTHPDCAAYFHIYTDHVNSLWFMKLKKFLMKKSDFCKVYNVILRSDVSMCMVYASIICGVFDIDWFIRLKKFLVKPSICRILDVEMSVEVRMVIFDEVEAATVSPVTPYKLPELMVTLPEKVSVSSLSTFINGLLWSCHPDELAIPLTLSDGSAIAGVFIELLKSRADSRSHPLRGIEVVDTDTVNLLNFSPQIVFRFKLHW